MERNEFIKSLGLGLALVCTGACMEGCGKKSSDPAPNPPGGGGGGTKVNVDLNAQLLTVGTSIVVSGVLFIRLATGNSASSFAATQALCPHQGGNLGWIQSSNRIECDLHHSQYTSSGSVLAQPNGGGTTTALKTYTPVVEGSVLSVTK